MAIEKSLTNIVCKAVRALQDRKGTGTKRTYSYAKEITQNNEIKLGKIQLALKNAVDKDMLTRTYDGKFKLSVPDVTNTDVKNFIGVNKHIMVLKSQCGCPSRRRRSLRRKRKCKPKRRKCRPRRRKSCRSCTEIWVPKKKKNRRCRRKSRPRKCRPRRKRRCSSCTPIWVPKRKKRCRRR